MYLHTLNVSPPSAVVSLTLPEDFSVAAGLNAQAQLVFPACENSSYVVAGGPECLQYAPRLGHGSSKQVFTFPVVVTALIIATESGLRPVPELYVGPRNLDPSLVALVSQARKDVRSKYSDNYESINYYTWECTWRRTDTNEILSAGPDAPALIYSLWPVGSEPYKYLGYTLAALKGADFADIMRFVDDFATI